MYSHMYVCVYIYISVICIHIVYSCGITKELFSGGRVLCVKLRACISIYMMRRDTKSYIQIYSIISLAFLGQERHVCGFVCAYIYTFHVYRSIVTCMNS